MSIRERVLRNTFFSSVAMYTEFALGMVVSILIARHLGPEMFGAYSTVIWIVAMGVAATNSGTASAAIRFVAELRGAGRASEVRALVAYLRRAQRWFMAGVLLICALSLWLAGQHVAPEFDHLWLFGFLVLAVALRANYMFNIGVAKGLEDFRINAMVALIAAPLNLALVAVCMVLDLSAEWLLGVFVVSGAVFASASWVQMRRLLPPGEERPMLPSGLAVRVRRQMLYSAGIVSIGYVVGSEVEVMFLTALADTHDAGQFKVGYQLAYGAAHLVPGVFGALLLPMMANALSQGRAVAGRRYAASTAYLALLALPLTAFGIALSGPLIGLLYGPDYAPAAHVFAVCIGGAALTVSTQGASSLLISADRQRAVLLVVLGMGVLKVALDALLIRFYALEGALVAFAVVAVINASAYIALARRESGVWPDGGRILRAALAAGLASLPLWFLPDTLPKLATLLIGGALGAILYPPLTLALGCWNAADIAHMQRLHARALRGRPPAIARLLAWAYARASTGEAAAAAEAEAAAPASLEAGVAVPAPAPAAPEADTRTEPRA